MAQQRRRRGGGGSFGTPSRSLDEAPPSVDQEANWVVSGGGLAGAKPDDEPSQTVRKPVRRFARRAARRATGRGGPGVVP